MPAVLKRYHSLIDKIEKGVEQETYKIVAQEQKRIIELNTEKQLFHGLGQKGQKLKPNYSRVRYARAKNQLNPLAGLGTPDLKVTGKFYNEFFLTAKNRQVEFDSSVKYAKHLENKYADIYGLMPANAKILNEEILLPKLLQWVIKTLKI